MYEKRIFVLNPFVNMHLLSKSVLVSGSCYFLVVRLIHFKQWSERSVGLELSEYEGLVKEAV